MKVAALMTPAPVAGTSTNTLSEIAAMMWDAHCGIVPIVDDSGRVLEVVTDRDICMAVAMRDVPASTIRARDLMTRPVIACRPDDDVRHALELMKQHHVRRLPVVGDAGALHGILSIDDIVVGTGRQKLGAAYTDVIDAFRSMVCARPAGPEAA